MTDHAGHIELERTVDSLVVGRRHRADLGDIDALAASIDREGLLQPPTVTPDGVLVCGRRRLAAIKQLGWKTVNVWVRSGISDRLGQLVAEQDDNVLHKPLTPLEAAALYRELKQVMAEDAARRQAATRFSATNQPGDDGGGNCPPPSNDLLSGRAGKTREQAAAMVAGGTSYKTLEKIGYLQRLVEDSDQPESLRQLAAAGLERIENGSPVNPIYEQAREAASHVQAERAHDLDALATAALARVKAAKDKKKTRKPTPRPAQGPSDVEPARYPVRAFVLTWTELESWWTHYDATELASTLTTEQIESFLRTVEGTSAFATSLDEARRQSHYEATERPAERGHLRAL